MKKEIFLIIACIAIYSGCDVIEGSSPSYREQGPYDTVVVYSLSKGCWKTKRNSDKLRRELEEAGIAFTEYFVNEDKEAYEQLLELARPDEPGEFSFTIPAVDVNGNILLNNPSLEEITSYFN
jgi:hypothetical protein